MSSEESFQSKISELCLKHFNSLPKTGKPKESEWTILSCILQEENNKQIEVVALGTGSRCIGHDKMSPTGDILNDSHAEIMCRRGFLRYIYENMLDLSTPQNLFVFEKEKRKFRLKNDTKFHFFTTFVPCGDAAIFPKQDAEEYGEEVDAKEQKRKVVDDSLDFLKPNKKIKTDIYRTGAKCIPGNTQQDRHLEGDEYHVVGVVRTKPGRGVSTLSASCSDKIAKWCHLGIQGSLLSYLIEDPIYLHTFTIIGGTPFDKSAIKRALFDRLKMEKLPLPFQQTAIEIEQSDITEFRFQKTENKFPSSASIVWLKTNHKKALEVAIDGKRQGITKKQLNSKSSRLKICKIELFALFLNVVQKYNLLDCDLGKLTYVKAKNLSEPYKKSSEILREAFKCWPLKPKTLLEFECDSI